MTTREPEGRRWFVSPSLWTQWLLPWFHREAVTKATSKRTQCSLQSYTCSDWKITFMHVQGSLTADCMTHDEPMLFLFIVRRSSNWHCLITHPHLQIWYRFLMSSGPRGWFGHHFWETTCWSTLMKEKSEPSSPACIPPPSIKAAMLFRRGPLGLRLTFWKVNPFFLSQWPPLITHEDIY